MRVALLADLHGNLSALDAALADIQATGGADAILALGDLAMLGPQPAEVIDRLRERGCLVVQGNTDSWYSQTLASTYRPKDAREAWVLEHYRWARPLLGEERVAYLLGLPFSREIDLGDGERLLGIHASPRNIEENILPDASAELLNACLAGVTATVVAFGHTHKTMVRRHDGITLVNPGTLGNPLPPDLDPRAAYGLVSVDKGRLEIGLRRVRYDASPSLAAALQRQMPGASDWVAKFARA
jgi:predicted phosphodiesterase